MTDEVQDTIPHENYNIAAEIVGGAWRFAGEHPHVTRALVVVSGMLAAQGDPGLQAAIAIGANVLAEGAVLSKTAEEAGGEALDIREYAPGFFRRTAIGIGETVIAAYAVTNPQFMQTLAEGGWDTTVNIAKGIAHGFKTVVESPVTHITTATAVGGKLLYEGAPRAWNRAKELHPREKLRALASGVSKATGRGLEWLNFQRKIKAKDVSKAVLYAFRVPTLALRFVGELAKLPDKGLAGRIMKMDLDKQAVLDSMKASTSLADLSNNFTPPAAAEDPQ